MPIAASLAALPKHQNGGFDLLISGRDATRTPTILLYTNDGRGKCSSTTQTSFVGVEHAAFAFVD